MSLRANIGDKTETFLPSLKSVRNLRPTDRCAVACTVYCKCNERIGWLEKLECRVCKSEQQSRIFCVVEGHNFPAIKLISILEVLTVKQPRRIPTGLDSLHLDLSAWRDSGCHRPTTVFKFLKRAQGVAPRLPRASLATAAHSESVGNFDPPSSDGSPAAAFSLL